MIVSPSISTHLRGHRITPNLISVVARHQPSALLLDLTNTSKLQLSNTRLLSQDLTRFICLRPDKFQLLSYHLLEAWLSHQDSSIFSYFRLTDSKKSPLNCFKEEEQNKVQRKVISFAIKFLPFLVLNI